MRKKLAALGVLLVLALATCMTVASGVAVAKITPVDTSCTTNGGGTPNGQQPSCKGGGLNQNTENQNPAGHAPGGQNP
jgi:hypothetical protein